MDRSDDTLISLAHCSVEELHLATTEALRKQFSLRSNATFALVTVEDGAVRVSTEHAIERKVLARILKGARQAVQESE